MDFDYILNAVMGAYRPPLGAFADLVFEVSSFKVLTYDDYKRETKARYAKHELINQTTVLEYLGAEPEEISFKMKFTTALKVNPAAEAEKARQMCLDGVTDYLILGNAVVGENLWVIESVSESAQSWDNAGNCLVSEVTVKMLEYVPYLEET
ncbi:MAG: phage tail protein [Selenomonadaceae bacterium]|nr:phage tail protein [Selenomonadaceae bacterium]